MMLISNELDKQSHGRLVKISSTSLLLNGGASEPALSKGNPVMESVTILTLWGSFLRGLTQCV